MMQRSVSERSREKLNQEKISGSSSSVANKHTHPVSECPHRARRIQRECARHAPLEAKLRQQSSRLEYVQSTPNVATIHGNKFASTNPRASAHHHQQSQSSKLCNAVSDGELLDVAILPIFQKLLTERHKSTSSRYGASIASCPNISIKCDIVEYL